VMTTLRPLKSPAIRASPVRSQFCNLQHRLDIFRDKMHADSARILSQRRFLRLDFRQLASAAAKTMPMRA
jgi:hypothetical protein